MREAPSDPDAYAQLGLAYLQQVRETGDPTFYPRAQGTFEQALRLDSRDFTATSGLGSLALARHDFRRALALGEQAARISPGVARNYGVIADAQIELGRYGAAERTLQHYVDVKPELSSYARVSYFRELHGDLPGALSAMRLAVTAGGGTAENVGYVQALVGKLHFDGGDYASAEVPTGRRSRRIRASPLPPRASPEWRRHVATTRSPSAAPGADPAAAVARVRDRPRRHRAGRRHDRGRATRLSVGWGRDPSPASERGQHRCRLLALLEADHGDPSQAVDLAGRAWAVAPSVRSADAYSWALSAAGKDSEALAMSERAMRLGSRDPSFLYHAGMVALRAGRTERAKSFLSRLVSQSPRFNPLYAPRAERALEGLR